jgi:hypothetical protein
MDIGSIIPSVTNPVSRNRLLISLTITVLVFILNFAGLMAGITVVLPHLF